MQRLLLGQEGVESEMRAGRLLAEASRKETANHFDRCIGAGMGSEINQ